MRRPTPKIGKTYPDVRTCWFDKGTDDGNYRTLLAQSLDFANLVVNDTMWFQVIDWPGSPVFPCHVVNGGNKIRVAVELPKGFTPPNLPHKPEIRTPGVDLQYRLLAIGRSLVIPGTKDPAMVLNTGEVRVERWPNEIRSRDGQILPWPRKAKRRGRSHNGAIREEAP